MTDNPAASVDQPEQFRVRLDKRQRLLDQGVDPYPVSVPITHTIAEIREQYAHLECGEETQDVAGVAGRVVYQRNTGKLCFVTLQDGAGRTLQAMLSLAEVGEESLAAYKTDVDLGDHLFVSGRVISSRRGELSIFVSTWQIASKALRPLPKTFTTDDGEVMALSEEERVRRRYVDLITRPAARDMVRTRAAVMKSLRHTLDGRGFTEVETPMLQVLHGGAAARPFSTHMNAFDMELFLRIAPELYLKRAVVGGVERVFEINRNFRNEGADSSHSPEFAMLEAYQAYGDYNTMAELTQTLVQTAAEDALGTQVVRLADGSEYDLSGQWKRIDLYESLCEALGQEVSPETSLEEMTRLAEDRGVGVAPHYSHGKIVEELWEELVGQHLYEPTFVMNYPVDTSPLTRQHRERAGVTEKWDLYVRGFELATAYSELVDPVVQRERFRQQALAAAAGDEEAMVLDEDFLQAMEYAMPPSGGMGMGMDRLLMALTGRGIRETIMFPLVKPQ